MRRMKEYRKYLVLFFFAVATIVVYKLVDRIDVLLKALSALVSVVSPFIIGLLIAFILNIPVKKLEGALRRVQQPAIAKHARGISVAVVYLLTVGLIVLLLVFVIPALASSMIDLVKSLPAYANKAIEFAKTYVPADVVDFDALLSSFTLERLLSYVDMNRLSTYAHGVFKVGSTVADSFIAAIVSAYMLLGKESLLGMVKRILYVFAPKKGADILVKYSRIIADVFYKYIYSQCLDAVIVGIACAIAFSIVGVPYGVLMGLIVGLSNLIPYFGAIIAGVCAVLLTLLSVGPVKAIITAILIIVIQQVDANILQPRIVSSSIGIKPLYVLFAITVGGGLFGVPGMLIGVPVVAVLKLVMEDLIQYTEQRRRARTNPSADA